MNSKVDKIEENIKELECLAEKVLDLKNKTIPRRPIVIEFCGAPKAGKSSCINSLELFLKRNNFRTKVLTERASVCPVKNKYDPLFNIWTLCSATAQLSEILANDSKEYDIVILDRGIFDALCWFKWLQTHDYLGTDDYKALAQFSTMQKWRRVIDLIYIFTATPEVSLEREYINLLTRKRGSIMQPSALESYLKAISDSVDEHGNNFRKIEKYDTSHQKLDDVNYNVTKNTLNILRQVIEERIGYIDKKDLVKIDKQIFYFEDFFSGALPAIKFGMREDVEKEDNNVQPIPIIVITDPDRKLVVVGKKHKSNGKNGKAREYSPEDDRLLLYFGGHTREEDNIAHLNENFSSIIMTALNREIKEELGIDFWPRDFNPLCIWMHDKEKSKKHLALCFICEKDLDSVKFKLDKNEFIAGGSSKSGKPIPVEELFKDYQALEDWSQIILREIFKFSPKQQAELNLTDKPTS